MNVCAFLLRVCIAKFVLLITDGRDVDELVLEVHKNKLFVSLHRSSSPSSLQHISLSLSVRVNVSLISTLPFGAPPIVIV